MMTSQTLNLAWWRRFTGQRWIPAPARTWLQRRPYLSLGILAVLAVTLAVAGYRVASPGASKEIAYHTVKRGDFLVSVIEGGSLRAVNEVVIRCEVDGSTRIISIAPEGALVKKGELLVELDSSEIQERLTQQELSVENAKFNLIQASENLEIQKSLGESNIRENTLRVTIAESDLEKYIEGDFPQQENKLKSDLTIAEEELKRAQDRYEWTLKLKEKEYASKSEVEADELALKRAQIKIDQLKEDLRLLQKYDYPKRKALFESTLASYRDDLHRLKQRTASQLLQSEADLEAKKRSLELQQARLDQYKTQLALTKIYAPQDGLVVYPAAGYSNNSYVIEEGASVRQRQELIKLPDTSSMLVEVKVHESFVNSVKPGLLAYVTVDSIPDRRFIGRVRRVAPLPDTSSRYMNPNLKVYSTEVVVEESLPDVKPGVSAHSEIVITNLQNVMTVPVQSVTSIKGRPVVFVEGSDEPVMIEVGFNNNRFVEVRAGLSEGQRVLLAPPISGDSASRGAADLSSEEVEAAKARLSTHSLEEAESKGSISRSVTKSPGSKLPDVSKPQKPEKPASKPEKPSRSGAGSN